MRVFCFGDSNTYGFDPRSYLGGRYDREHRWVDLLASRTGWEVLNEGENGRTIPRTAPSLPPGIDLLILLLGTNDLLQGSTPQETAARMEHLLLQIPLNRKKILLIAPPPMARGAWISDDSLIEDSRALAEEYRLLAKRLGIHFADAGRWEVSLAFDGVHFTPQGHCAFAAGLLALLEK